MDKKYKNWQPGRLNGTTEEVGEKRVKLQQNN